MFPSQRRGADGKDGELTDEERKKRQEAGRRRFIGEMHRFMVDQTAGRRAKTISYMAAMGKRRAQRGMIRLFRRGGKRNR
jgi:hypothetical protein